MVLCGVRDDFAKVMHSSGLAAQLGKANIFLELDGRESSTLDAVRFAYDLLQGDYCSFCPRRGEGERDVLYYMI